MSGVSWGYGKNEVVGILKDWIPLGSKILDVGAGSGTYRWYFGCGYEMDGVEVFPESIEHLRYWYNEVYEKDIRDFVYQKQYDLIIFGDILEHLSIEDAQRVLKEAEKHGKYILVAVPYNFEQGELYGNIHEVHLQPDLTHEKFKQRYPGYKLLFGDYKYYGYYIKENMEV